MRRSIRSGKEEDEKGEGNQNEETEEDIKTNSAQILANELYTIFIFSSWLFASCSSAEKFTKKRVMLHLIS